MNGEPTIGVICLDTAYTKVPGHIRNPATFDFPVRYRVVSGATPRRLITEADPTLLQPFIDAAHDLQTGHVSAITSACGFLILFQAELAAAVDVPLYSSSLVQLPMVSRLLRPGRRVGLLTADKAALTPRHLAAAGATDIPLCTAGMAGHAEFREVILEGQRADLDMARLEREVLDETARLARDHPDLGALVIECTDLVPFAHAIQQQLHVPIFDIVTLTNMVHAGLSRQPYAPTSAPGFVELM
jgi:hypothetical protein